MKRVYKVFLNCTILSTLIISNINADNYQATSLSCDEVKNDTEQAICDDEYLIALDMAMIPLYMKAQQKVGKKIEQEQNQWIKKRNQCKKDFDCIVETYKNRLIRLSEITGDKDKISGDYGYGDNKQISNYGKLWVVREPDNTLNGAIYTVTGPTAHTCEVNFQGAKPTKDGWKWVYQDPDGELEEPCHIHFIKEKNAFKIDATQGCQYFCGARGTFRGEYFRSK